MLAKLVFLAIPPGGPWEPTCYTQQIGYEGRPCIQQIGYEPFFADNNKEEKWCKIAQEKETSASNTTTLS